MILEFDKTRRLTTSLGIITYGDKLDLQLEFEPTCSECYNTINSITLNVFKKGTSSTDGLLYSFSDFTLSDATTWYGTSIFVSDDLHEHLASLGRGTLILDGQFVFELDGNKTVKSQVFMMKVYHAEEDLFINDHSYLTAGEIDEIVNTLNQRDVELDEAIHANTDAINDLRTDLTDLSTTVENNQYANTVKFAEVDASIEQLKEKDASLESLIKANTEAIESDNTEIEGIHDDITNLTEVIEANKKDITVKLEDLSSNTTERLSSLKHETDLDIEAVNQKIDNAITDLSTNTTAEVERIDSDIKDLTDTVTSQGKLLATNTETIKLHDTIIENATITLGIHDTHLEKLDTTVEELRKVSDERDDDLEAYAKKAVEEHVADIKAATESIEFNATRIEENLEKIEANTANIATEIEERTTADTELSNRINTEVEARTEADTTLQANLDTEAATRLSTDEEIKADLAEFKANTTATLDDHEGRIKTNEENIAELYEKSAGLRTDLDETTANLEETKSTLNDFYLDQTLFNTNQTETNRLQAEFNTQQETINAKQDEVNINQTSAIKANASLGSANATSIKTLSSSVDTLGRSVVNAWEQINANKSNISAEEIARVEAVTTLQTNIDAEVTARTEADNVLQTNISAEETARVEADTNLQEQIDSIQEEQNEQNNLIADNSNRIGDLGTKIDDLDSKVDQEVSGLDTKIDQVTTDVNTKIDQEIKDREKAITDLTTTITDNQSDVEEVKESVDSLAETVKANSEEITSINKQLEEHSGLIYGTVTDEPSAASLDDDEVTSDTEETETVTKDKTGYHVTMDQILKWETMSTLSSDLADTDLEAALTSLQETLSTNVGEAVDDIRSTVTDHTADTTIHVTSEDKALWNASASKENLDSHINDTAHHIQQTEREAWNAKAEVSYVDEKVTQSAEDTKQSLEAAKTELSSTFNDAIAAHTSDTSIHVTEDQKTAWTEHSENKTIHVTSDEKLKWDNKVDYKVLASYITKDALAEELSKKQDTTTDVYLTEDDLNKKVEDLNLDQYVTTETFQEHLGDDEELNLHVSLAEKNRWNLASGDVGYEILSQDLADVQKHAANEDIHVTVEQKEAWDAKPTVEDLVNAIGEAKTDLTATISEHTEDESIHVTLEDKARWDAATNEAIEASIEEVKNSLEVEITKAGEHIDNSDIHITAEEREAWNNQVSQESFNDLQASYEVHSNSSDIHVTAEEKAAWNAKQEAGDYVTSNVLATALSRKQNIGNYAEATTVSEHTDNTDIHVTLEDKARWDAATNEAVEASIEEVKGSVEEVKTNLEAEATKTSEHIDNSNVHITPEEREAWNAKQEAGDYVTNEELTTALEAKQDAGDYVDTTSDDQQINGSKIFTKEVTLSGNAHIHGDETSWFDGHINFKNAKVNVEDTSILTVTNVQTDSETYTEDQLANQVLPKSYIEDNFQTKITDINVVQSDETSSFSSGTLTVNLPSSWFENQDLITHLEDADHIHLLDADKEAINKVATIEEALNNKLEASAINDYALQASLNEHTSNETIHLTAAEKAELQTISSSFSSEIDNINAHLDPSNSQHIQDGEREAWNAKVDADYVTTAIDTAHSDINEKIETNAREIANIEAGFTTLSEASADHVADTTSHVTSDERELWNAKVDTDSLTNAITAAIDTAKTELTEACDLHSSDTTVHITADERTTWNDKSKIDSVIVNKSTDESTFSNGELVVNIPDEWFEQEPVTVDTSNFVTTETLSTSLADKANKTDVVTLTDTQTISGTKFLTGGLGCYGSLILADSSGTVVGSVDPSSSYYPFVFVKPAYFSGLSTFVGGILANRGNVQIRTGSQVYFGNDSTGGTTAQVISVGPDSIVTIDTIQDDTTRFTEDQISKQAVNKNFVESYVTSYVTEKVYNAVSTGDMDTSSLMTLGTTQTVTGTKHFSTISYNYMIQGGTAKFTGGNVVFGGNKTTFSSEEVVFDADSRVHGTINIGVLTPEESVEPDDYEIEIDPASDEAEAVAETSEPIELTNVNVNENAILTVAKVQTEGWDDDVLNKQVLPKDYIEDTFVSQAYATETLATKDFVTESIDAIDLTMLDTANLVTTDTEQVISANKTITGTVTFSNSGMVLANSSIKITPNAPGTLYPAVNIYKDSSDSKNHAAFNSMVFEYYKDLVYHWDSETDYHANTGIYGNITLGPSYAPISGLSDDKLASAKLTVGPKGLLMVDSVKTDTSIFTSTELEKQVVPKSYVDNAVANANVNVDLTNYATTEYVNQLVTNASIADSTVVADNLLYKNTSNTLTSPTIFSSKNAHISIHENWVSIQATSQIDIASTGCMTYFSGPVRINNTGKAYSSGATDVPAINGGLCLSNSKSQEVLRWYEDDAYSSALNWSADRWSSQIQHVDFYAPDSAGYFYISGYSGVTLNPDSYIDLSVARRGTNSYDATPYSCYTVINSTGVKINAVNEYSGDSSYYYSEPLYVRCKANFKERVAFQGGIITGGEITSYDRLLIYSDIQFTSIGPFIGHHEQSTMPYGLAIGDKLALRGGYSSTSASITFRQSYYSGVENAIASVYDPDAAGDGIAASIMSFEPNAVYVGASVDHTKAELTGHKVVTVNSLKAILQACGVTTFPSDTELQTIMDSTY
jgi:DNA repair exonuclease SbcCD ATPase subunit